MRFLLAAASALALSAAAQAADGPSRKAAAPAKYSPPANVRIISIPLPQECPADDNESMNGLKAFIDPETGELRAGTPEEEAGLARAIAGKASLRAQMAHEVVVGPNGGVGYYLGDEGMVDFVVRTGSDGKPMFFCVPRSETPKALTRPIPASKKNEAAKEEK